MIKRAMISGLSSTGVGIADLRVIPAAVARHLLKTENYAGGFHVGISPSDPEAIRIQFFEQPGIEMTPDMQKEVEKHFTRGELRRVAAKRSRHDLVSGPAYASGTERPARDARRRRDPRARLSARRRLRLLGVVVRAAARARPARRRGGGRARVPERGRGGPPGGLAASIGQAKRLVPAVGADVGAVFDRAGERLYLIDEQAREIPVEQALLLYLSLIASSGRSGKLAFPVTVTSQVDRLIEGTELEIVRTRASLPELTKAAVEDGVVFAGAVGGGYVFPDFLPGYDAVASLAKLLELLATVDRPISSSWRSCRRRRSSTARCRARGR